MNFEDGNKELDDIIEKLESGKVNLKDGTKLFERANEIAEELYKEFDNSKGKVTIIKENLEKLIDQDWWFAKCNKICYNIYAKV